jgi:hypothetical protein
MLGEYSGARNAEGFSNKAARGTPKAFSNKAARETPKAFTNSSPGLELATTLG